MSADAHDQWHRHTPEEGVPQHEHGSHASAKALGITFIAITLGVLFVIIILKVYFDSYMDAYRSEINETNTAAAVSWGEKQEILSEMAPYIPDAAESVIAEYATND
ncbi:MAG: hypothetical protein WD114_06860 [Phycisphaerales bacterium]